MNEKQILMIPGPTSIPQRVMNVLGNPAMGHRTDEFSAIIKDVTEKLKKIYRTENDLLLLSASGTGSMEAAVCNFVSPGDKVVVMENGYFSNRWANINRVFGAEVQVIEGAWGVPADPKALADVIAADKDKRVKAVFVTLNETSTGVTHDIPALRNACGDHPAIFVVDAISGMGVVPLETDAWKLDVVVSGSQKAFMLPPGLSFISVSPKAWALHKECKSPSFYFSLSAAKKEYDDKSSTPYTPAANLISGLQESLLMLEEEGLENVQARHRSYRSMIRAAVKALGLTPLADDAYASTAVTAVVKPEGLQVKKIVNTMKDKYNIVIVGGQGKSSEDIFRIGHLGYVTKSDILATVASLEMTLTELGYPCALGKGVAAVQEIMLKG
ncbi:MAG: alanine--glyoxylate aminotransferase family protein [Clostridiales bacterium]|nr:alanine--glyoxylate aminotransferase family protein [Clostridiales bacterium]